MAETDQAKKEQLLNEIVRQPDAGPTLLRVAMNANDTLTKWMSIRGIGIVKYRKAVPFLIDSLTHQHPYVRANAARALGEIKDPSASPSLIRLLGHEKDGGVIEQTT
jgi:HEAT repeat protein